MAEENIFKHQLLQHIMANGKMVKKMVLVLLDSHKNNFIKELLWNLSNMDMEYKNLLMEIYIRVNIVMVDLMVKVNIFGLMDHHMMEILQMEQDMVMDNGNLPIKTVIYILVSM